MEWLYSVQIIFVPFFLFYQGDATVPESFDETKSSIKIAIPEPLVGWVIGKDGSGVKEINSKTGASIKILQSQGSHTMLMDEKPLLLMGTVKSMLQAQRMVLERMQLAPPNLLEKVKPKPQALPQTGIL